MRKWLFLLCLMPGVALSAPAEVSSAIRAEQPYGTARLRKLGFTIYDASLWTDAAQWSMDAPFALTLRYALHFTPQELADRTVEEMERQPGFDAGKRDWRKELLTAYPEVADGDTITALYEPGKPVRLFHNGAPYSELPAEYSKPFFAIWLGEATSEPDTRRRLLHLSSAS